MLMLRSAQQGILVSIAAYAGFAVQDAAMKWIVADFSVWEALFWRSLTVLILCLLIGRRHIVQQCWHCRAQKALLWRGLVTIIAWLLYYQASRELTLAKLTTLYFAAPVIVVLLAVMLLKERPNSWQWLSVFIGLGGVIIACHPSDLGTLSAALSAFAAAALWAYTYIILRQIGGRASLGAQMLSANLVFVVVTGASLPWTATSPSLDTILLMAGVGVIGGGAQYLLFFSFSKAEASVLAPFEYTGLIWAFILSFVIWNEVPDHYSVCGALLIMLSGAFSLYAERQKSHQYGPVEANI